VVIDRVEVLVVDSRLAGGGPGGPGIIGAGGHYHGMDLPGLVVIGAFNEHEYREVVLEQRFIGDPSRTSGVFQVGVCVS
jgi:hypothetical protein